MTISVPTTKELNLPHKEWRPYQKEAIQQALDSKKKVVFLSAPTGCGKSSIAVSIAKLAGRKSAIITFTKSLQRQYIEEFKALDLSYIIGRENYKCIIDDRYTVANAACTTGWSCHKRFTCTYYEKKIRAAQYFSPIVTNYPYFLGENWYAHSGLLSGLDVLILDEGHLAENSLMAHVNVTLDDVELKKVGLKLPNLGTINHYVNWATGVMKDLFSDLQEITEFLKDSPDPFSEEMMLSRHRKLLKVHQALQGMYKVKKDWIMEKQNRKVKFRPVWVKEYGNMFTAAADKVIIQSATIVNPAKMADLLGYKDYDVVEIPSLFPKERRPFKYFPVAKIDKKTTEEDFKKVIDNVDAIIDKHPGERGIIHTVNYHLRDMLLMRSKHSSIMLTHKPEDREKAIEEFIDAEGDKRILVSPSVMSGLNAPYHRCSFQIIMKVPFRDRSEEQVRRRMEEDPEWYSFSAACDIVQAYGRAMRYADDYGVTYMLDENFGWFFRQNQHMFPSWFTAATHKVITL